MKNEYDEQLISRALNYWANHIETGHIHLSASDLNNNTRIGLSPSSKKIKPLNLDDYQKELVIRLRKLAER